jgi:hypothetical protein
MNWAGLLLTIIVFAGILVCRKKYIDNDGQLVYGVLSLASIAFFAATLSLNIQIIPVVGGNAQLSDSLQEWGRMSGIAIIMSALIILIREEKPSITRFPVIFCWIPLLLVPVYALVMNSIFLKEILLGIYEAGSMLVALLMYSLFLSRDRKYLFTVIGISVLIIGFIFYWIIRTGDFPQMSYELSWISHLIIAWGAGLTFFGIHNH